MAIFRIHITLASGQSWRYTGLFADGFEATEQALADFPGARRVAVLFVARPA